MKHLLLLLFIPFALSAAEPYVEIYKTHDDDLYGRSRDRDIVISVNETVFERFKTLEVDRSKNFSTSVTMDSRVVDELNRIFETRDELQRGFVTLSRDGDIYTLEDDNTFLNFSFSFSKPSDEIISVIEKHYYNNRAIRDIVKEHYLENYVINIHTAENILFPEAAEITYDEVIIMATIIGDKDQWLWGIHDGRGYLEELLFN